MIDAWSGPTPTPQQWPANEPNGIKKLLDKIAALELQIKEKTSNLLGSAGIRLSRLGMFIDSSLTVGGSLATTGNTTIGGNAAITGTLSLPNGIIDNAALASPVKAQYVFDSITNFALTTTFHSIQAKTITVPAGFTSAVVSVTARVMAINPNTTGGSNGLGADYLYAGTNVDGFNGNALPLSTGGSGGSNINVAPFSTTLTGLTAGSTFTITIDAGTAFLGWAANASNVGEASGHILWFR